MSASDAQSIDPLSLPYVALSELRYLPDRPGVYFAIEESGAIAYIGQSVNIRRRWHSHPISTALCASDDLTTARRVRVAWMVIENIFQIAETERALIRRFRPRLNDIHNGEPKERRRLETERVITNRRTYMDKFKVLSLPALEARAMILAERLMAPRVVTKPVPGRARAVIGYIWRDDQGCIHRTKGPYIRPTLREYGYFDKARDMILQEYKLTEQLPLKPTGKKAKKK